MLKLKKLSSLVLVVALTLALVLSFTGCGANSEPTQAATTQQGAATTQQATTAVNLAAQDPAELKWYMVQEDQPDSKEVFAKANEMIKAKINATVDFQFLPWANFDDKMKMIIASAEMFDLCYTSNWTNNYALNVGKGAYIQLDDLIDKYGPTFKTGIPSFLWNGIKINGKIYGLPNYQVEYTDDGVVLRKDLVEKYGIDVSKMVKYEDLGSALEVIKKNEPGIYPTASFGSTPTLYRYFSETKDQLDFSLPLMIDSNLKISYIWDDPEFMARYNINHDWSLKGYIPKDPNVAANAPSFFDAGKIFTVYSTSKPGNETDFEKAHKRAVVSFVYGKPKLDTQMVTAALTAISSTSKNPERAMQLMDLMNSDKDLLNTLTYGIQDKHYKKTGDNTIELLDASKNYSMYAWELGNQFLAYTLPGQPADVWEQTKKGNEEAVPSPSLGFTIDIDPIKTETAAVQAVYKKYETVMATASLDPNDFLAKMKDEYNKAGLDALIAGVQKQLDDWKAANGK